MPVFITKSLSVSQDKQDSASDMIGCLLILTKATEIKMICLKNASSQWPGNKVSKMYCIILLYLRAIIYTTPSPIQINAVSPTQISVVDLIRDQIVTAAR